MRILIADDHKLFRDTLELWFQGENIEVMSAGDLDVALGLMASSDRFDLILLDYRMPGMNGLAGLTRALEEGKGARVALMSGNAARDVVETALEMGCAGFLPKTLPARSLVNAVRFMAMGETHAPVGFQAELQDVAEVDPLVNNLAPRESQVLEQLSDGKSDKEIARELGIQEATVRLHMKTLFRKIGASNRTQAAMIARDTGIF